MKRDTILIVDNDEVNRKELADIFRDEYKILEVSNEKDGLDVFKAHITSLAAILVNLTIVIKGNFQVLKKLSQRKVLSQIPFIMITSEETVEYESKGFEYGIISYIRKPFYPDAIKQMVDNVIQVFQYKRQLELTVRGQTEKMKDTVLKAAAERQKHTTHVLIESLSNIIEFRNLESEQHVKRIREFTFSLGRSVMHLYPEYELTEEKIDLIGWASSLHDIGKIVVPDNIILKPGKLNADEYEIIKSHTTKGAEIIERVIHIDNERFCEYAYDIARHHHEKYDGKGYPDGIKGEEISIAAQIVALIDVYDALSSKRVYKAAYDTEKAYQMVVNGHSGSFSPKLLKAFTEVRKEFEVIVKKYCDD